MAVASLVLGIISLIIGFVPIVGSVAFVPAVVGLVLGIVDLVNSKKETNEEQTEKPKSKKGYSIAGVILSGVAIFVILFWNIIVIKLAGLFTTNLINAVEEEFGKSVDEITEEDVTEMANQIEDYIEEVTGKWAD
ncbi:MAG: DUF4190 domain-containing protein [Clostridia bacterium]|nr:DUF4190 domain-containing protein [Clostridia bacterium]